MSGCSTRPVAERPHCDAVRFLMAGGLNTVLTFAVYQLLLSAVPHRAAYAMSWLCGLAFVMVFYPSKVFVGGKQNLSSRLWLGASYVAISERLTAVCICASKAIVVTK